MSLAEVENGMAELQDQTEIAVGHLQQESEEKDAEIEAANREIEKLGHQVYILEEENERIKEVSDRLREDEAIERERLEALPAALKDVSSCMYRGNDRPDRAPPCRKWQTSRLSSRRCKISSKPVTKTYPRTKHAQKS